MNIKELEKSIHRIYELDLDVDDELIEKIQNYINSDKEEFVKFMNAQEMGLNSYRPIIYEALAEISNGLEDMMLDQIKNIIEAVEKGNENAKKELPSIGYFTDVSDLEESYYTNAIEYLRSKLNSNISELRKVSLTNILDLHLEANIEVDYTLRQELQKLLTDQDFDVRLVAFLHLGDNELLPKDFKQSVGDKLKTRLSPVYKEHMRIKGLAKMAVKLYKSGDL